MDGEQIIVVWEGTQRIGYVERFIHDILGITKERNKAYHYSCFANLSFANEIKSILSNEYGIKGYNFVADGNSTGFRP